MAVKKWSVEFISCDPYVAGMVTFEAEEAELINPRGGRLPHANSPVEMIGEGVRIDGKVFMCEGGVTNLKELGG